MAKRKRVRAQASAKTDGEAPLDVVGLGQSVGTFETINGLPHGVGAAVVAVVAVLLVRPIARALSAFLRG